MDYLDDFPKSNINERTQTAAEEAFRSAIIDCDLFIIQREDKHDYGTDFQIEVKDNDKMTNVRVHIQVKGTESKPNKNSSISKSIYRTNLNYLFQQPSSLYICYHLPTDRLLVRYVEDVLHEYEHEKTNWEFQKEITVNFRKLFCCGFQTRLKAKVLADAKANRNYRFQFIATPPAQVSELIQKQSKNIFVPMVFDQAINMLRGLYNSGEDAAISDSFDQFAAVLNSSPEAMMLAYMAEINLGINGQKFNKDRVRKGIEIIETNLEKGQYEPSSLLYSIGNGWLALGDLKKSEDTYLTALKYLDNPNLANVAAQCTKNLGSVFREQGLVEEAAKYYHRALKLDSNLSNAHLALSIYYRNKRNFIKMLDHLDQTFFLKDDIGQSSTIQGWRVEALFNTGDIKGAFREIRNLISQADKLNWVWPWCAKQVAIFGKESLESTKNAIPFWNLYLQTFPDHIPAKMERLFCFWLQQSVGHQTEISFEEFKQGVSELVSKEESEAAYLWDRVGHWAQYEDNWVEAEKFYRKAYNLEPEKYGYCLGTALNFLKRYSEALPILLLQAEKYLPDAMSWFQVAIAQEGLCDIDSTIKAYHKAIELDKEYDISWFNLGGILWNKGETKQALEIWKKAIELFPTHELAEKLREDLPFAFK